MVELNVIVLDKCWNGRGERSKGMGSHRGSDHPLTLNYEFYMNIWIMKSLLTQLVKNRFRSITRCFSIPATSRIPEFILAFTKETSSLTEAIGRPVIREIIGWNIGERVVSIQYHSQVRIVLESILSHLKKIPSCFDWCDCCFDWGFLRATNPEWMCLAW